MKLYETIHQHDGITDYSRHTSLSAAKKWMRERLGSKGHITKVYANGDWRNNPQRKQRHQDEQPDNSDILVTTSRGANHSPA